MVVPVAKASRIALLVSAVLSAACGGSDATAPQGPALLTHYGDTDDQIAIAGTAVENPPAVLVADAKGHPLSGVPVTFVITLGGGTVAATPDGAGASRITVVTNTNGVASTASWTLGAALGQNILTATVAGVTPLEFVAVSADKCSFAAKLTLGARKSDALADQDCDDGYFFYDFYRTPVTLGNAVFIKLQSASFDTYLELYDLAGNYIAINNDRNGPDAGIKALLRTNNYIIGATSAIEHAMGPYTIDVTPASPSVEGCEEFWISTGITTNQTLSTTDCVDGSNKFYADRILIILAKGQKVTITMNSGSVDAFLQLDDVSGATVALDDNGNGGTDARLVYTSPALAAYYIDASTHLPGQTGNYTLTVQ